MMMILRSLTKLGAWCHWGWIQVVAARPAGRRRREDEPVPAQKKAKQCILFSSQIRCICYLMFIYLGMHSGFLSRTAWALPSSYLEHQIMMTLKRLDKYMEETRQNIISIIWFVYLFLNLCVSGSANCLIHTAVRQEAVRLCLCPSPSANSLEEDEEAEEEEEDHPYWWSFFPGADGRLTVSAEGRVYSACSRVKCVVVVAVGEAVASCLSQRRCVVFVASLDARPS